MLEVVLSNQCRKDYKPAKKRGYDVSKLHRVVGLLAAEAPKQNKKKDGAQLISRRSVFFICLAAKKIKK